MVVTFTHTFLELMDRFCSTESHTFHRTISNQLLVAMQHKYRFSSSQDRKQKSLPVFQCLNMYKRCPISFTLKHILATTQFKKSTMDIMQVQNFPSSTVGVSLGTMHLYIRIPCPVMMSKLTQSNRHQSHQSSIHNPTFSLNTHNLRTCHIKGMRHHNKFLTHLSPSHLSSRQTNPSTVLPYSNQTLATGV